MTANRRESARIALSLKAVQNCPRSEGKGEKQIVSPIHTNPRRLRMNHSSDISVTNRISNPGT